MSKGGRAPVSEESRDAGTESVAPWAQMLEARWAERGCRRRGGGSAGARSAAVGVPAARRCGASRTRTPRGRGRRYGRLSVGWLAERQGAGPVGLQGGVERGKTASVRWRSRALSLLCCRFAPPPHSASSARRLRGLPRKQGFRLAWEGCLAGLSSGEGASVDFASGRFSRRPLWACGCSAAPARCFGKGHQLRPSFACCLLMHLLCFEEGAAQRDSSSRPLYPPLAQNGNRFEKKFQYITES